MDIASNLNEIRRRIEEACRRAGRDPQAVGLVAVSKGQPPQTVAAAAEAGCRLFGESKVQEAKAKIPLCPGRLRWHLIGHLQTNKCRDAVALFQMIESVDSLHLAQALNEAALKLAKTMPVLLQVNVAGESTKFGYNPDQVLTELDQLNALARLEIHGLMTIAPYTTDPARIRACFRRLRELKEACEQRLGAPLPHLSMGMSGDYPLAVEEGATLIRVGTALLGPRQASRARPT